VAYFLHPPDVFFYLFCFSLIIKLSFLIYLGHNSLEFARLLRLESSNRILFGTSNLFSMFLFYSSITASVYPSPFALMLNILLPKKNYCRDAPLLISRCCYTYSLDNPLWVKLLLFYPISLIWQLYPSFRAKNG
jgi:hypothetical protein